MQIIKGDMWSEIGKADLILFTANSTVKNGNLIMGGGAALEAAQRFRAAPLVFGQILEAADLNNGIFGLMFSPNNHGLRNGPTMLGALQTKAEVWKPSDLGLVEYSINLLHAVSHNWERIVLNYPGIGLGGLDIADVQPLIENLPDNVIVYTYEKQKIADALVAADNVVGKLTGTNPDGN